MEPVGSWYGYSRMGEEGGSQLIPLAAAGAFPPPPPPPSVYDHLVAPLFSHHHHQKAPHPHHPSSGAPPSHVHHHSSPSSSITSSSNHPHYGGGPPPPLPPPLAPRKPHSVEDEDDHDQREDVASGYHHSSPQPLPPSTMSGFFDQSGNAGAWSAGPGGLPSPFGILPHESVLSESTGGGKSPYENFNHFAQSLSSFHPGSGDPKKRSPLSTSPVKPSVASAFFQQPPPFSSSDNEINYGGSVGTPSAALVGKSPFQSNSILTPPQASSSSSACIGASSVINKEYRIPQPPLTRVSSQYKPRNFTPQVAPMKNSIVGGIGSRRLDGVGGEASQQSSPISFAMMDAAQRLGVGGNGGGFKSTRAQFSPMQQNFRFASSEMRGNDNFNSNGGVECSSLTTPRRPQTSLSPLYPPSMYSPSIVQSEAGSCYGGEKHSSPPSTTEVPPPPLDVSLPRTPVASYSPLARGLTAGGSFEGGNHHAPHHHRFVAIQQGGGGGGWGENGSFFEGSGVGRGGGVINGQNLQDLSSCRGGDPMSLVKNLHQQQVDSGGATMRRGKSPTLRMSTNLGGEEDVGDEEKSKKRRKNNNIPFYEPSSNKPPPPSSSSLNLQGNTPAHFHHPHHLPPTHHHHHHHQDDYYPRIPPPAHVNQPGQNGYLEFERWNLGPPPGKVFSSGSTVSPFVGTGSHHHSHHPPSSSHPQPPPQQLSSSSGNVVGNGGVVTAPHHHSAQSSVPSSIPPPASLMVPAPPVPPLSAYFPPFHHPHHFQGGATSAPSSATITSTVPITVPPPVLPPPQPPTALNDKLLPAEKIDERLPKEVERQKVVVKDIEEELSFLNSTNIGDTEPPSKASTLVINPTNPNRDGFLSSFLKFLHGNKRGEDDGDEDEKEKGRKGAITGKGNCVDGPHVTVPIVPKPPLRRLLPPSPVLQEFPGDPQDDPRYFPLPKSSDSRVFDSSSSEEVDEKDDLKSDELNKCRCSIGEGCHANKIKSGLTTFPLVPLENNQSLGAGAHSLEKEKRKTRKQTKEKRKKKYRKNKRTVESDGTMSPSTTKRRNSKRNKESTFHMNEFIETTDHSDLDHSLISVERLLQKSKKKHKHLNSKKKRRREMYSLSEEDDTPLLQRLTRLEENDETFNNKGSTPIKNHKKQQFSEMTAIADMKSSIIPKSDTSVKRNSLILLKSDLHKWNPSLWRLKPKNILQRYDPIIKDGVLIYTRRSSFCDWNSTDENMLKAKEIPIKELIKKPKETLVQPLFYLVTEPSPLETIFINEFMKKTAIYQDHFEVYIQTLFSQALDSNFLIEIFLEKDDYFLNSVHAIDEVILSYVEKLSKVFDWGGCNGITQDLKIRPSLTSKILLNEEGKEKSKGRKKKRYGRRKLKRGRGRSKRNSVLQRMKQEKNESEACEGGCGNHHSLTILLAGRPYHSETLRPLLDSPKPKELDLCDDCKKKAELIHRLVHQKCALFAICLEAVHFKKESCPEEDTTAILNHLLADEPWIDKLFKEVRLIWAFSEKYLRED